MSQHAGKRATERRDHIEGVTLQATCRFAAEPPVLDGKLDDPCWKTAALIDRFGTFWSQHERSPKSDGGLLDVGSRCALLRGCR